VTSIGANEVVGLKPVANTTTSAARSTPSLVTSRRSRIDLTRDEFDVGTWSAGR